MDKVLVLSNKKEIAQILKGYNVEEAMSSPEVFSKLFSSNPSVIVADENEGIEDLLEASENEGIPIIVITENRNISHSVELIKRGAFDVLIFPFKEEDLILSVEKAVNRGRPSLKKKWGFSLVGESEPMQKLWEDIRRVSRTESTVLIKGESGSGKELVARAIHLLSSRKKGPFVSLNCAAIPEELIESELFGHERGSFTGAIEKKIGKFEAANGGVLFLDEIGEMSLKTQAKLLRAIETGEIERIGSNKPIFVDVRIIAATNRNLEEMVKAGRFREDLYYRISVVVITVPPLRKRKDDIPILFNYFMRRFCEENNYPEKKITPKAMEILKNYNWPGNVRELKNLVERLMTMVNSQVIDIKHIPDYIIVGVDEEKSAVFRAKNLRDFKERAERLFILQKLKENDWNIKKTAEALGTPRSNLYRKLIQYGIIKKGAEDDKNN